MKLHHLTLAFLIFSPASAVYGSFYANVRGTMVPVTTKKFAGFHLLVLGDISNPSPRRLSFANDLIVNKNHRTKQVFGIFNGFLAFGKRHHFKTLKVELDGYFKLFLKFKPHLCGQTTWRNSRGYLMEKDSSSESWRCSPVELYFIPIDRFVVPEPEFYYGKREIKESLDEWEEESLDEWEEESMDEWEEERIDSTDVSESRDVSSFVDLHSRLSISDSKKAGARQAEIPSEIDYLDAHRVVDDPIWGNLGALERQSENGSSEKAKKEQKTTGENTNR